MRTLILTTAFAGLALQANAGTITVVESFGEFEASGSLDVEERVEVESFGEEFDDFYFGTGIYNTFNNTGGDLVGFGVSNSDTLPAIFTENFYSPSPIEPFEPTLALTSVANEELVGPVMVEPMTLPLLMPGPVGCKIIGTYQTCYSVRTLYEGNWNEEIAYVDFSTETVKTFQDIYGEFEDVVGDDNMFNWFDFQRIEIFNPREGLQVVEQVFDVMPVDTIEQPILELSALKDGDSVDNFFGFLEGFAASSIIGASSNGQGTSFYTAGAAVPPAVPLPAAAWMLMAGIGGLGAIARRKKA